MARPRKQPQPTAAPSPPSVSVVIPCAGDPFLAGTVRDVLATAPGCEVVVVWDGTAGNADGANNLHPWQARRGVGPSRDAGIAAATGEVVVLMDAHMRPHGDWLAGMLAVLQMDPAGIACSRSGVCNGAGDVWSDPAYYYTGARVRYQTELGWPLEPGWLRDAKPGQEIPLALGGCYAIRRDRYNAIGVPWRRAIGWGSSEQTLCLVNWFLGGATYLADADVDHIYRGRGETMPYKTPDQIQAGQWYNRLRLVDLLPMPTAERDRMTAAVMTHAVRWGAEAQRMLANRSHDEARDAMGLAARTWDEWCAFAWPEGTTWVTPRLPPPVAIVPPERRPTAGPPGRKVVVGAGREVVKPGGIPLMQTDPRGWL